MYPLVKGTGNALLNIIICFYSNEQELIFSNREHRNIEIVGRKPEGKLLSTFFLPGKCC